MDRYGIIARFAEPSTWASIAGLAALFVHSVPVPQFQAIATIGATIAGALGVLMPEVGKQIAKQTGAQ